MAVPQRSNIAHLTRLEPELAQLYEAVRAHANKLPSLLVKACRGELVPQDLSDEPADALLERLNATQRGRKARAT